MHEFEISLPELFPAQEQLLASDARFNVVHGGAESGKTTAAIDALLLSHFGALQGFHTVFLLPDEDAVVTAKRRVFALIHPLLLGRLDRPRIDLVNGGSIRFAAADDDALQLWDQVALVVVDDAAKSRRIESLWFDMFEPLLTQHRGHAWFFSTPAGARDGFANLARLCETDPRWATHRLPTTANPHFDRERLERDRERLTVDEWAQERDGLFVDTPIKLSANQQIIAPGETFREWCERLACDGLKVDGHPFRLDDRPAMHFIYDLIPSTVEDAFDRIDVIMKCTQVGFTVMEMLAMIYLALRFAPAKIGMFMPSQMLASGKSTQRFMPIVRTVPSVYAVMTDDHASGTKGGEGNVLTRNLGDSLFYFLWTSGKTATESNPMDVISFDEVQEMAIADMEKTRERMSASILRYTLMGSTANWPDEDIHWWFKKGTQHQFNTHCSSCDTMQVLDEHFPECIRFDPAHPRHNKRERDAGMTGEYRYVCHSCGAWMDDPQQGAWVAKTPDAAIRSVHFPQFLSPTITPRSIIEAYWGAKDMKNFYNRKLGKPYVDPSQVPVNMEMLHACASEGMRLGVRWKTRGADTFLGIDQMGAFNVAIVAERLSSGHMAIIHVEEIYDLDPFARCSQIIEQFGVRVCVVETLPNYNDAKRFANRHPGIVFLASYADIKDDMLRWGDDRSNRSERRTDEEERDRYVVTLDQYKCMQVAFARIQNRVCVFPDPKGLVQEISDDGDNGIRGEKQLRPILEDRVFFHFTRTALIAERDEEQNKYRRRVVKVGIDPHFSYAFMLLNVAWARAHGTTSFLFADDVEERPALELSGAVAVSDMLSRMLAEREEAGAATCAACASYDSDLGQCMDRYVAVRSSDPACVLFLAEA